MTQTTDQPIRTLRGVHNTVQPQVDRPRNRIANPTLGVVMLLFFGGVLTIGVFAFLLGFYA